ncbi:probable cytochrome P450 313a4, partial [Condylostylus longicornis]|uniref:probable cytochrome P450 313a4 n=1 Tax=Condylostylus longicornis TaxID=2530218 RepID=UPI00244DD5D4
RLEKNIQESKITLQEENKTNESDDFTKQKKIFVDVVIDCFRNKQFSWDDLENESNVILASSFESSASTLTNTLTLLAMFPQQQERLFEELKIEFPDKNSEMLPERVHQLPYLDMVINEGMRLLAPIPLVGRTAGADFDLGTGVTIPKGTQVLLDIFNMQRDPEVWGSDAQMFNPEHFSPEYLQTRHPFAYLPFAKGIRSCVGSKYAMAGMKMICTKLIRNYKISTDFKFQDLEFREDIGLKFVEVPKLRFEKRE